MLKHGTRVSFGYEGRLASTGEVFDSRSIREPLEITIGQGSVFPLIERTLAQMAAGEEQEVHIPCAKAYGAKRDDAVKTIPLSSMPEYAGLEEGMEIMIDSKRAIQPGYARVAKIDKGWLTLDFNHPLAGEDLVYRVELVNVFARSAE